MSEVTHDGLPTIVEQIREGRPVPVYLLWGDDFLCRSGLTALVNALVSSEAQGLNYEALDGASPSLAEVPERLNTYPLLPGRRVVALIGTDVFHSKVTAEEVLTRCKEAYDKDDLKGAVRRFQSLLALSGLAVEEVKTADAEGLFARIFPDEPAAAQRLFGPWVGQVMAHCLAHCLERGFERPSPANGAKLLEEVLEAGFPEVNHLILTSDLVDKRLRLYKIIKTKGVAVDCSAPKADRAADRRRLQALLKSHSKGRLAKVDKTISPGAAEALYEKTGGDLRTFDNELEKLISFVGRRKEISAADVDEASERTKEDPLYELNDAVGQKDRGRALRILSNLLRGETFPLQILAALANLTRRLLLVKAALREDPGLGWKKGMDYGVFSKRVWPQVQAHGGAEFPGVGGMHPYAAWKVFGHADHYSFEELVTALQTLLAVDMGIKTGIHDDPGLALERAVLGICGPKTFQNQVRGFKDG